MRFAVIAASLLGLASAYDVLTPTLNSTIAKGSSIDITWDTVDTDPSTFSIYIVNFATAHWPPTVLSLAQNVPQNAGSQTVRIPCSLSSDYGWQINFINGTNTYVIYAQSDRFSLTGSCVDPTTTSSSSAIPSATGSSYVQYNNTIYKNVTTYVEEVVYENPIIWFLAPAATVVGAGVTVTETVTVTPTACGVGASGSITGTAGGSGAVITSYPVSSSWGNGTKATGTGSYPTSTGIQEFTGAGSSLTAGNYGAFAAFAAAAYALLI
ncbi:MAG: hypothetical protein M1834_007344 [Cirrosporium novae-zelandiae]|nr:MAG: hypothetical protein M1834_007344 [Cirrosporium novae-zelandiae]